jgi:hypothetical protein
MAAAPQRPARRRTRTRRRPGPAEGKGSTPGSGSAYEGLADRITEARLGGDYAIVHELLAGWEAHVYEGFARWLAGSGRIGAKRLMALAAMYATSDVAGRAGPQAWILRLVPAPAGRVDKKDIRDEAARVAPYWADPAPGLEPVPGHGGADDDGKEAR